MYTEANKNKETPKQRTKEPTNERTNEIKKDRTTERQTKETNKQRNKERNKQKKKNKDSKKQQNKETKTQRKTASNIGLTSGFDGFLSESMPNRFPFICFGNSSSLSPGESVVKGLESNLSQFKQVGSCLFPRSEKQGTVRVNAGETQTQPVTPTFSWVAGVGNWANSRLVRLQIVIVIVQYFTGFRYEHTLELEENEGRTQA